MYELIQVAPNSYYMDCPAKVGFYAIGNGEVVLIDSGSDKDAAKKVKKILDARGWKLKAIYNTHSHADHTGGNQYLQAQTGCRIFASGADYAVASHPVLEPVMLYGAYPMKELQNKFLMAKESKVEPLTADVLPEGLEIVPLPGHSYDMVGFRTADNVIYLADSLSDEETLNKYQICFLYDVRAFIDTLEKVKTLQADCFIPSHAAQTDNIVPLAQMNIDKVREIAALIAGKLETPMTFEALLAEIFNAFHLNMNLQQRMLVGSTVKSYLSYLKDEGMIGYNFEDNYMIWSKQ